MTIRLNILGETYDDVVPCFFVIDNYAFDRVSGRMIDLTWLNNYAQETGYTLEDYEIDLMPASYGDSHLGIPPDQDGNVSPPGSPVYLSVNADLNAETITFSGGPTTAECYVSITYELDGGGQQSLNVGLAIGTTPTDAATLVAAEIFVGGSASANGAVVTVTATDSTIEQLAATVVPGPAP